MTTQEQYRLVFNAPGGHEVLADLASHVERMGGTAGQLFAHINKQLFQAPPPPKKPKPDPMKASGGRIAHG